VSSARSQRDLMRNRTPEEEVCERANRRVLSSGDAAEFLD
jgi:hypothetical protein